MENKLELNTVYMNKEGEDIYIFDKGNEFYFGCSFSYNESKNDGERSIKLNLDDIRCYDLEDCFGGVVKEANVYYEGMLKVK